MLDFLIEKRDTVSMSVPDQNTVSFDNSTETPLVAGDSFTGAWEDARVYDSLIVAAKTDQDGVIQVQFSPDGVNADSNLTRYYKAAGVIEAPHRFTITRRYFRVIFDNTSGSDQTFLRMQTLLGNKGPLNAPSDAVVAQDFDSTVVRPTHFNYEVGLGIRQGYETWNKWGYNADVDAAAPETLWSVGGMFQRMTSADTLDVSSSDANDAAAGTGAQSIVITGVDGNLDPQVEVVTLDGVTPVTTSLQWSGVNRMAVYLAGTGSENAGTIQAVATGAATVQGEIPAAEGSTQQAIFFVPAKHKALMDWLWINGVKEAGKNAAVLSVKCFVTSLVSGARYEVARLIMNTETTNEVEMRPSQPFVVGEKSLVEFTVSSDQNDTAASCRFSLVLAKDFNA